jgi:tetratricopeptide (TPR) repeat protein
MAGGNNELLLKYVSNLFDRPRLKNLARLGVLPMLQEWFTTDSNIDKEVAVFALTDLWLAGDFRLVPGRLVYHGVRDTRLIDPSSLMAEHKQFWSAMMPVITKADRLGYISTWNNHIIRQMSSVANNLGVLMEDLGRKDDAFVSYCTARSVCPENVSALLNQWHMVSTGYVTDRAKEIKRDINAFAANTKNIPEIWSLSRTYGYVRMPEAFAGLGWTWALSGRPSLAICGLNMAMRLLPDEKKGRVKQILADVYMVQENEEAAESIFYELLVENPSDPKALLGMARISAKKGDMKKVLEYLKRAEIAKVPKSRIAVETAAAYLATGSIGSARVILEEFVTGNTESAVTPDRVLAWLMLVGVIYGQGDEVGLERCVNNLREGKESRKEPLYLMPFAQGHLALLRGDMIHARACFDAASSMTPDNARVLELLLRIDVFESKQDLAESHLKNLLKLDPGNAFANYVRGSLQMMNNDLALAEDSLRRSVERTPTAEALNDLAWLLQRRGVFLEAEQFANRAVRMNDKLVAAWDTLGVVLMRLGRLDEAAKAFERCIALSADHVDALVHLTELEVTRGNKKKAIELIGMLAGKQDKLSVDSHSDFNRIKKMLE